MLFGVSDDWGWWLKTLPNGAPEASFPQRKDDAGVTGTGEIKG